MEEYLEANEPIGEVLSHYRFGIQEVRNIVYKGKKGVWWVTGRQGEMVLKKVSSSERTLRFIIACTGHLSGNGIKIPEIVKTSAGQDYVVIGKTCFVLSKAVNGRKLDAGNPADVLVMSAELGRFHKASVGFRCPAGAKPKNHLGTWIMEYEAFLEDMNAYYRAEREKRTRAQVSNLIVREFPYFYERARQAISGLAGEEYSEWVRSAHRDGSLCHQDFSSANLIEGKDGIYVLDTDSLTIDIPARDVRKLLNKVIKKAAGWDDRIAAGMLSAYRKEMNLSGRQLKVISYDLMFPHLFLGAMDKYVYKRDQTWGEEDYYRRLNEMLLFEKSKGSGGMPGVYANQGSRG